MEKTTVGQYGTRQFPTFLNWTQSVAREIKEALGLCCVVGCREKRISPWICARHRSELEQLKDTAVRNGRHPTLLDKEWRDA